MDNAGVQTLSGDIVDAGLATGTSGQARKSFEETRPVLERLVAEQLAPQVQAIDQGRYPDDFMRAWGELGGFSQHALDGDLYSAILATEIIGETCGSTAFSSWCQNACGWYLRQTDNTELKERLLSAVGLGRQLAGTGLSNPVKSLLNIETCKLKLQAGPDSDLELNGALPWVSNLGNEHCFGAIAANETGHLQMVLVDCQRAGAELKQTQRFVALEGTATFGVRLKGYRFQPSDWLAEDARAFLPKIRAGFILLQLGFGFGLVRGAIAEMRRANRRLAHTNRYLPHGPELFEHQLGVLHEEAEHLCAGDQDPSAEYLAQVLQLRLNAAEVTRTACYSAFQHQGSLGYFEGGSCTRRIREAMFFDILSPSVRHLRQWIESLGYNPDRPISARLQQI